MKVTITVTEEHIRAGKKQSRTDCPIALAVRDLLPNVYVTNALYVEDPWAYQGADRVMLLCVRLGRLPKQAVSFIMRYDKHNIYPKWRLRHWLFRLHLAFAGPPRPLRFTVDLNEEVLMKYLDQVSLEEVNEIIRKSPSLEVPSPEEQLPKKLRWKWE